MQPHRPSIEESERSFRLKVRSGGAHHPANRLAVAFAIYGQKAGANGNAPLPVSEREYYDLGSPGVGKTHLSVALAEAAIQAGFGAYFMTAHDLVSDLGRAYREGRLDRRLRVYLAPRVLIID